MRCKGFEERAPLRQSGERVSCHCSALAQFSICIIHARLSKHLARDAVKVLESQESDNRAENGFQNSVFSISLVSQVVGACLKESNAPAFQSSRVLSRERNPWLRDALF
jgi:hypothetical protein